MKEYAIPYFPGDTPRWADVPELLIDTYPWGCPFPDGKEPQVAAELALTDAGLHVLMACGEANPRATFTENNQPVCQDSCLEFFVNFAPEKGSNYLNFEVNANGAIWSAFGPDRDHRQFLKDLGLPEPEVKVHKSAVGWGVEYLIPHATIETFYQKKLAPGTSFTANFYKCGDHTDIPHYAVWNSVVAPEPDYHRPECFGICRID